MHDKELIEEIKKGNERAFKELVESYKDLVVNTCYGFLQSHEKGFLNMIGKMVSRYKIMMLYLVQITIGSFFGLRNRLISMFFKSITPVNWIGYSQQMTSLISQRGSILLLLANGFNFPTEKALFASTTILV